MTNDNFFSVQAAPSNYFVGNTTSTQGQQRGNISSGALVGFSAFAVAGAVVALNIVGFPEVEAVEFSAAGSLTAAGSATLGAGILAGEPLGTMAVGAVTGGAYGVVVGGGIGAAIPITPY
ncbi:MAG: hypothetical protein ABSH33_24670 [Steroidobacteraceae bacterium]